MARYGSYYGTTKQEAEQLAAALRTFRIGAFAYGVGENEPADQGRIVVDYAVERYSSIMWTWGVIERWRYSDQPDGYVFGSGFLPLRQARSEVAKAGLKVEQEVEKED